MQYTTTSLLCNRIVINLILYIPRWIHLAGMKFKDSFQPQKKYEMPERTGLDGLNQWEASTKRGKAQAFGVQLYRCSQLCLVKKTRNQ